MNYFFSGLRSYLGNVNVQVYAFAIIHNIKIMFKVEQTLMFALKMKQYFLYYNLLSINLKTGILSTPFHKDLYILVILSIPLHSSQ